MSFDKSNLSENYKSSYENSKISNNLNIIPIEDKNNEFVNNNIVKTNLSASSKQPFNLSLVS